MRWRRLGVKPVLFSSSSNSLVTGVVTLLGIAVVAGCTSSPTTTGTGTTTAVDTRGPITIGTSLSLTGNFSTDGVAFKRGYELWVADVNAHGGVGGRQVKLTILDDGSSPNQVVANYQKLFSVDHVDLAFGPFSSVLTGPASEVAGRFGMALIEGAGGAPAVFDSPTNQADHNVFDVSLPIADEMDPLVSWIASLPPSQRPKTAAYPTVQDPFGEAPVQRAQALLQNVGVNTLYSQVFPETDSMLTTQADQVAQARPQLVVLGSTDVPTVAAFMREFARMHYRPKLFIAAAGPDQGSAFSDAVGVGNADGMMVPNGWYPGYANADSARVVAEYVRKYGGPADGVNADVAEAYSVGQVASQAIIATGGTDNAKIISYLHSGVRLASVQGPVQFDPLGENGAAAGFIFQWQGSSFNQVLPVNEAGSVAIMATKPDWTH